MKQNRYIDLDGVHDITRLAAPGPLAMTNRQEATVIAALTLWRAVIAGQVEMRGISGERLAMIASDDHLHEPLTPAEVDEMLADLFRVAA